MMSHELYRVEAFWIEGPYRLRVRFDDGTEQLINFAPILVGEMYGPLRDLIVFNGVKLDAETGVLVWPNGADFDPETLRNWPQYEAAWVEWARNLAPIVSKHS